MAFITPLESIKTINSIAGKTDSTNKVSGAGNDFESTLKNAIQGVKDLETQSQQASYDIAVGNTDDLNSAMIATTKAQTAIELTTQITTRAVNAYKEIMQIQI